jgi:hypothetical protein
MATPPTFPAPSPLVALLASAGLVPALTVSRANGAPLTEADETLVRRVLAAYGDGSPRATDAELSAAMRAQRANAPKATDTDG